ncbi:dihydroneopterin aldolase [Rubritalea tangerina]|uniref:dihydroneopterin aldolase n=1 Tax=Rubritalea tangerina TaxID=430798 RepID=A0ABW4ZAI3_9BACT
MKDTIIIKGLEVELFIGVPDEERAAPQILKLHLELVPENGFSNLGDAIEKTVNYYEVAQRVKELGAERPRKLIETFTEEVAAVVLSEFAVLEVTLEIEKFILPDTDFVGLRMWRSRVSG